MCSATVCHDDFIAKAINKVKRREHQEVKTRNIMSSSMFIESSSPITKRNEWLENVGPDVVSNSGSNLVVVYGKNGISFDRQGLENLAEERSLSSISVVRLTSPTPSMQAEEKDTKIQDMLLRKQVADTDESYSNTASYDIDNSEDDDDESNEGETNDDTRSTEEEEGNGLKSLRKLRKCKQKVRHDKTRPEIVGLTVEEFYPPEAANELAKQILKYAGVSKRKHDAEYEFQLYVIQNDHCYTPYTSPSQMNAKLVEGTDKIVSKRKIFVAPDTVRHLLNKKKLQAKEIIAVRQPFNKNNDDTTSDDRTRKNCFNDTNTSLSSDEFENMNKDVEKREEVDNEEYNEDDSNYTQSDESAESDNDRDSDLDFDVNNRNGRKRKTTLKKTRRSVLLKVSKRHQQSQDDIESPKTPSTPTKINPHRSSIDNRKQLVTTQASLSKGVSDLLGQKLPSVSTMTQILSKKVETKRDVSEIMVTTSSPLIPSNAIRRGPSAQIGPVQNQKPTHTQSLPQLVKQIGINKVASPKGGFTDISYLLSLPNSHLQKNVKVSEIKFTSTPLTAVVSTPIQHMETVVKGFMPLGIETATKNQLPAQISVQTHQSSSELAAEHDKQLDLIDSIVKNEINNSGIIDKDSMNQNIPELVMMLESTEKAVLEKSKLSSFSKSVEDIDIANAPLLESPEHEIPEDLLQHVVDLIEDDKTLQDAVVKQVFVNPGPESLPSILLSQPLEEDNQSTQILQQKSILTKKALELHSTQRQGIYIPSVVMQRQNLGPQNTFQLEPSTTKSIIQATISNVTPNLSTDSGTAISVNTINSLSSARNEPIQIVRGNGRVITLPPIEAPTTRAKRRALVQPKLIAQKEGLYDSPPAFCSFDSNQHSNESFSTGDISIQTNSSICNGKQSIFDDTMNMFEEKPETSGSSNRRTSKENISYKTSIVKKKQRNTPRKLTATEPASTQNNDESQVDDEEDEDDPNKLWCICRQPHNNRFMICCDVCEDWFHGTCVSITKSMGLDMELKGIEWTCPKCVKKQEEKKQRKITDIFNTKNPEESPALQSSELKVQNLDGQQQSLNWTHHGVQLEPQATTQVQSNKDFSSKKQLKEKKKFQLEKLITMKKFEPKNISIAPKPQQSIQKNIKISRNSDLTCTPIKQVVSMQTASIVGKSSVPKNSANLIKTQYHQQTRVHMGLDTIAITNQMSSDQANHSVIDIIPTCNQLRPQENLPQSSLKCSVVKDIPACIVCKKNSRSNSIYCSDDCIRKHAQNALINVSKHYSKPSDQSATNTSTKAGVEEKKKNPKGLFEDLLCMADRKPKVERVYVFERKTGRILTGSNAPTTANLKKWLHDNPTFEVVQPGSAQASDIEKLKYKHRSTTCFPVTGTSPSTIPITSSNTITSNMPNTSISNLCKLDNHSIQIYPSSLPAASPTNQTPIFNKVVKELQEQTAGQNSIKPLTPKQLTKYPQNVSIKPDKQEKEKLTKETKDEKYRLKKKTMESKSTPQCNVSAADTEPVRLNVRRTLREQLMTRMNELSNEEKRLTADEVEFFATDAEKEMFRIFNRDIGSKYKAKYRSLMFNIKDRKNQTLIEKICAKDIEPKQLVRMSPEELASQELAQWRQNEAKHQLEMIKKSELDLLSCTKNYVLKTHKGEEVIEGKSAERVDLDITIPVEDVVSVLINSGISKISEFETVPTSELNSIGISRQDTFQDIEDYNDLLKVETFNRHVSQSQKKETSPKYEAQKKISKETIDKKKLCNKEKDREQRHKSKDRHREKSKTRKRSCSRSQSGEKSHKSLHKDEKKDKEERSENREREFHRECMLDSMLHKDDNELKWFSSSTKSTSSVKQIELPFHSKSHLLKQHKDRESSNFIILSHDTKNLKNTKPLESFNLIDQILESTKTVEEAANLLSGKEKNKETKLQNLEPPQANPTEVAKFASKASPTHGYLSPTSCDQAQTSSSVLIASLPDNPYIRYSTKVNSVLWTGNINMIDVASFQTSLQPVSGKCGFLQSDLPNELDVVGRIVPDIVWDYISKIKKSPNKEIVIICLLPSCESETMAYTILYKYLDKRKRLGVIKTTSPHIKDFYIMPLGCGRSLPTVLQPVENFQFFDDECRPDMLLGILIRITGKRSASNISSISSSRTSHRAKESVVTSNRIVTRSEEGMTPPRSPKYKSECNKTGNKNSRVVPKSGKEHKVDHIDVDAIIKAPISSKISKPVEQAIDDANDPYSPGGGSSDDEIPSMPLPQLMSTAVTMYVDNPVNKVSDIELKQKMDELNRQIETQKMEIAGLLNVESAKLATSSSLLNPALASISIPSNLSQILASIKNKPEPPPAPSPPPLSTQIPPLPLSTQMPPPPLIGSLIQQIYRTNAEVDKKYNPLEGITTSQIFSTKRQEQSSSRLAQLSEAELLSLVPDDIILDNCGDDISQSFETRGNEPSEKKPRWSEPPPPGIE